MHRRTRLLFAWVRAAVFVLSAAPAMAQMSDDLQAATSGYEAAEKKLHDALVHAMTAAKAGAKQPGEIDSQLREFSAKGVLPYATPKESGEYQDGVRKAYTDGVEALELACKEYKSRKQDSKASQAERDLEMFRSQHAAAVEWRDLLCGISVDKPVAGHAARRGRSVVLGGADRSVLFVARALPKDFTLRLDLDRLDGGGELDVMFKSSLGPKVVLVLDRGGKQCGLELVDGKVLDSNRTLTEKIVFAGQVASSRRLEIVVRGSSISVASGDEKLFDWQGNASQIAPTPEYGKLTGLHLAAESRSTFRIDAAQVRDDTEAVADEKRVAAQRQKSVQPVVTPKAVQPAQADIFAKGAKWRCEWSGRSGEAADVTVIERPSQNKVTLKVTKENGDWFEVLCNSSETRLETYDVRHHAKGANRNNVIRNVKPMKGSATKDEFSLDLNFNWDTDKVANQPFIWSVRTKK